jgi:hypothetical protein
MRLAAMSDSWLQCQAGSHARGLPEAASAATDGVVSGANIVRIWRVADRAGGRTGAMSDSSHLHSEIMHLHEWHTWM